MSIRTEVADFAEPPRVVHKFPLLRKWVGSGSSDGTEPLVVFFMDRFHGVPLATGVRSQIGKYQEWVDCDDKSWVKCSITLTSES